MILRLTLLFLVILLSGNAAHAADASFAPVQRFIQSHCIECHGDKSKKADLDLKPFADEQAVIKGRKTWERIVEMVVDGEMPPKKRPRPADSEQTAFVHAVHSIFEKADKGAIDPGRVTVRRLNRAEYNNTIRDLVYVDFEPAADFPSDEVGYGFDNIGDVLSISPVLMERYFAAAEGIVQRAIMVEPSKPVNRRQAGRYLEPAGSNVPQTRFRPVIRNGVNTPFRIGDEGEYTLRTRVYATNSGSEKVKVAWTIDQKQVAAFEVDSAATEKQPMTIEQKVNIQAGNHRFALMLLNASENDPKRTLHVEFIEVAGPTDPRPSSHRKLLAVDPKLPQAEQTRVVVERFASRAYRRPATKDEVGRLVQLVTDAQARGAKWEAGIQVAFQAVLCSPKFLFRLELDDGKRGPQAGRLNEVVELDDWQLASRLSYFLWSSMPDEELFNLASKAQLRPNLDAQVKRMLADPKSQALVDNFAMQWLQLRRLRSYSADSKMFPMFDDRLKRSMQKETELFVGAVFREDRSILDLIDADFTFMDRTLAQFYGIADTAGNKMSQKPTRPGGKQFDRSEWVRVPLADKSRGGILTQASILAVTSNPTRTSPVKRGKFILEQILGTPPPPPPGEVPELKAVILTGTLRQQMVQHRENPACASCHAKMDPLGFAFENFNAVGQWRDKENNTPIDASGTLPDGKSFQGPAELKAILKDKKELFARCLAEKMLTYAIGRGVEYYDRRALTEIVSRMDRDGYRFSSLVIGIVRSDPFTKRRARENG